MLDVCYNRSQPNEVCHTCSRPPRDGKLLCLRCELAFIPRDELKDKALEIQDEEVKKFFKEQGEG